MPFALLGGVVGFFGQGNMKVAGLVLNFLALIPATIVLVMFAGVTGLAGVGAALGPTQSERRTTQQGAVPGQRPAEQPGTRPNTPPPPATAPAPANNEPPRADVGRGEAWIGEVQVQVTDLVVGKVPLETITGNSVSKDDVLIVKLSLLNTNQTKKVDYRSWAGADFAFDRDYATLKDNFGNGYKRVGFGLGTRPVGAVDRSEALYPNKPVTEVLVFEVPLNTATYLFLELPAKNYGGEGMVRFRIPLKTVRNEAQLRQQQEEEAAAARKAEQERQRAEAAEREARDRAENERRQVEEAEHRKAAKAEQARLEREARERRAAEHETAAERRLAYAQKLLDGGKDFEAKAQLQEVIDKYPDTKAADKARELLKKTKA